MLSLLDRYWDRFEVEPEELVELTPSEALVTARLTFAPQGTGVTMEQRYFHVWEFRDSTAVRLRIFTSREQALEAAGSG